MAVDGDGPASVTEPQQLGHLAPPKFEMSHRRLPFDHRLKIEEGVLKVPKMTFTCWKCDNFVIIAVA